MHLINNLIRLFATLLLGALLAGPVMAQATEVPSAETPPSSAPEPTIAAAATAEEDADNDRNIALRMQNIFREIDGLRGVGIRVQSGVVTLTGTVTSQADRERAEAIAARFAGVVTVENAIDRTFEVDSNLSPILDKLANDVRGVARAVPLLGVAVVTGLIIAGLGSLLAGQQRLWRWVAPNAFMAELLGSVMRIVAIIAGIVVALQILGATALLGLVLGSAGVIGIALGFAVRDTVDNFVSSLMLSLRQPFRANDHVLIGESEGLVIRLTSRATILMTLDGNHLRIPNATVFKAIILNYSRNPQRRFEFDLGIDSDDDPLVAMQTGLAAIRALPIVLDVPRSHAVIEVVGDSSIVLRFFAWIDQRTTDFGKGRSLGIQAAKSALEAAGFVLPEPIYRIRLDGRGTASGLAALAGQEEAAPPKPRPPQLAPGAAVHDDTGPDSAVAKLVREEREEGREPNLLDTKRPIE